MHKLEVNLEDQLRQSQPLIILGMHRSGTSLAVRLLTAVGIHMGSHLSRDAEAIFFQKLNRRIFLKRWEIPSLEVFVNAV